VGEFDGQTFKPEHEGKHRFIYGPVYAGQCFSNPPDGRAVYIGWARGLRTGDAPFQEGFTLPLRLTLHETPHGIRMRGYPIQQLDRLHDGELFAALNKTLAGDETEISFETDERIADIHITVKPAPDGKTVSLSFSDGAVVYDVPSGCVRGAAKAKAAQNQSAKQGDAVTLRVLIDRPMYEIFLNHGETYLLQRRDAQPLGRISLKTQGTVEEFRVHKMKSIWK
jgi:fructan beta-fructosidase